MTEPRDPPLSVRLPTVLRKRIDRAAKATGLTRNAFITRELARSCDRVEAAQRVKAERTKQVTPNLKRK